jgi:hypothetical protein
MLADRLVVLRLDSADLRLELFQPAWRANRFHLGVKLSLASNAMQKRLFA